MTGRRGNGQHARRRSLLLAAIVVAALLASIAAASGGTRVARSAVVRGVPSTVQALRPVRLTAPAPVARTDASLLRLRSARPVPILIKLADAPLAARGRAGVVAQTLLRGGRRTAYLRRLAQRDAAFASALVAAAPTAEIGRSLRVVYGGIAAIVPGNAIARIARLPGVVAVQRDVLRRATGTSASLLAAATASSPGLVASDPATGSGVVVATIDSGLWPEHPALAAVASLPVPRPTRSGLARICRFGDDPTTPAVDPFLCNRKVIGGDVFLDRYREVIGLGGEPFPDSARDGDGHGTATATIAAGDPQASAPIAGIDRGPFQGVAPAASLLAYKALSRGYGYDSDIVAAIDRAVADGADVILLPVSGGGGDPATDPVALALLDAYAAGVSVVASAGNDGPADGTAQHGAPWIMTVGSVSASTTWQADLTLASGADTLTLTGTAAGSASPAGLPIVAAADVAAYPGGASCHEPAAAGTFAGAVVVCAAGTGSPLAQGRNVLAGNAVGLVLVDAAAPTPTANVLPAVTLGTVASDQLRAFLGSHVGAVGAIGQASRPNGVGSVVSPYSGRGTADAGVLKPDLVAPGEGLLAATTPVADPLVGGPAGDLYAVVTGTSAASAVAAGAAAAVRWAHPALTPGEVRSALATTAAAASEGGAPASPLAAGSGVVDLARARDPGLVLDVPAADLAAATTPATRLALNLPSIVVPALGAGLSVTRVVHNIGATALSVSASIAAPPGLAVTVSPPVALVAAGGTATFSVAIDGTVAGDGTSVTALLLHAVEVAPVAPLSRRLAAARRDHERSRKRHGGGDGPSGSKEGTDDDGEDDVVPVPAPAVHDLALPVVLVRRSASVAVAGACDPATVSASDAVGASCSVAATNPAALSGNVRVRTSVLGPLRIAAASGATTLPDGSLDMEAPLVAATGPQVLVGPADPASDPGFLDLSLSSFAVTPTAVGVNDALQLSGVAPFVFAGQTWTSLAITSNGTVIAGGLADPVDRSAPAAAFPDPARPNGLLAPFWTSLDGTGAPGVRVARVAGGGRSFLVIQWDLRVAGTASMRTFEVWIGQNGVEDITFTYDQARLPSAAGLSEPLSVGAENADGSAGDGLGLGVAPVTDLRVSSTAGVPAPAPGYSFNVVGTAPGDGWVVTAISLVGSPGETVDRRPIHVTP